MNPYFRSVLLLMVMLSLAVVSAVLDAAPKKNGFDLSGSLIPVREIRQGGPPRDGIPAIHYPEFYSAAEAGYLKGDDRVLGVVVSGSARAYPIKVLNWHEIVNDQIGVQKFAVTYCPLCGTGMVFASNFGEVALVFGVSGLLYNSDVLLYDHQTESLWSQMMTQAVTGPFKGTALPQIPAFHTTWRDWVASHPETEVMKLKMGAARNYEKDPYEGYDRSRRLYFSVNNRSGLKIHPKERVLGVSTGTVHKAYPFEVLQELGQGKIQDSVGGQRFTIYWNEMNASAHVTDAEGKDYPTTIAFWFAWYAFHPATELFEIP